MIFGTLGGSIPKMSGEEPGRWGFRGDPASGSLAEGPRFRIGLSDSTVRSFDTRCWLHREPEGGAVVAGQGEVFNREQLARRLGLAPDTAVGRLLAIGCRREGASFFREVNGGFAVAVCDPADGRLWLARDHLGIEPLFFVVEPGPTVRFSSILRSLVGFAPNGGALDPVVLHRYMLLKYNPGADTFFRGIRKVRPGHVLRVGDSALREERYWRLSFEDISSSPEREHVERIAELVRDAVAIRLGSSGARAGAFLSGGLDSSSVVSIMGSQLESPVHTFSFRCRGKSFDESRYARAVSRRWETRHHEIAFEPEMATSVSDLVALQQEPLSDVGVEVSTYHLARQASGAVDFVLTGDGGDEAFAGHPVYLADKLARWYGRIPSLLRRPFTAALQLLPDGREKKSLLIKAKRFAYSFEFPADLHAYRWRIYYKPGELERLLSPEWRAALDAPEDPLRPLREAYAEADGPDPLSVSLYGDYLTEVDFHLRRMETVRRLGPGTRFPYLDRRLIEYAARIPSELKVTSDRASKHLLLESVVELLPEEVANRQDKLGNSIPLKNWLRESTALQEFVLDTLSPEALERRGIVDPTYVGRLWRQHQSGRQNHSHRIWALLVLELWLQEHMDGRSAKAGPGAARVSAEEGAVP